jgi:hypothetical protein
LPVTPPQPTRRSLLLGREHVGIGDVSHRQNGSVISTTMNTKAKIASGPLASLLSKPNNLIFSMEAVAL